MFKSTVGNRYGRLEVIKDIDCKRCICKCDCGSVRTYLKSNLIYGNTKSCGCYRKEFLSNNNHTISNISNMRVYKNNSSGVRGVSWMPRQGLWRARIKADGKDHSLGTYKDKQDAIRARKDAERTYFDPMISGALI